MTKDNTFFFLNAHGTELNNTYKIPSGIRIIMFCYSKKLYVSNCFDEFNWAHILLNPDTSTDYNSFINTISKYKTIRDHFCIYETGDTIYDINIYGDKNFRDGLFRLPVRGYGYEETTDTVILSDGTLFSEINSDPIVKKLIKRGSHSHIKVDNKRLVKLFKNKKHVGIFKSFIKKIHSPINLSSLIKDIKKYTNQFTILLMICRDGNYKYNIEISKGKNINASS